MKALLRDTGKRTAGWLLSRSVPRYRYRNCVFILAHMRCGSTALSNILCSRPDVSGYGEAHIRHDGETALGQLALNQMRRGGWKPQAPWLFDKILHSRHDDAVPPEFFDARAIFVVRRPGDAIGSIVRLFAGLKKNEYGTREEAAGYYVERLAMLEALWHGFPARRRIGLTHEALMGDPAHALECISERLGFVPPLKNIYTSPAASRRGGGGDPLVSGRHTRIDPALSGAPREDLRLELRADLLNEAQDRYRRLSNLFLEDRASV
ncbi:sulfotransferase family protein [Novosphingobium mangrovi (ex Huang et al. 2023)]|uniref:Sulfotransferase n=1 Tax=Novosphingobium mangrovi (ex Huang et al. 2023) TaxID=2976432 RepID=A0ABT2I275_9SPHN|nr:sulfotransferase [Novosphingobium mangrovi (ex Huang et al. 2023)]MCT2398906.1 sulfotransferase [Novosphingobium mangrovi (ex Huang et al. 2023)]